MATQKTAQRTEGKKEGAFSSPPDMHYGSPIEENRPDGYYPLRVVSLYRFGLSTTKLQFDPRNLPRILPGVLVSLPGNPLRLSEEQQYIAFSDLRLKDGEIASPFDWEVVPSTGAHFGLLISPFPIVMGTDDIWGNTVVRAPEGTFGFSFYASRKFEISTGFVLAYLRRR